MQNKIDILTDLLSKSGLKPTQKNLAFKMFGDIVARYNITETYLEQRIKKDYKIKGNSSDYFERFSMILELLGINQIEFETINQYYFDWIFKIKDEIRQELTYNALLKLFAYLKLYEICYDGKLPENMDELKKFILEPLQITEENFENEYLKSLEKFKTTHEIDEVMKLGWAKNIMGKVVKK